MNLLKNNYERSDNLDPNFNAFPIKCFFSELKKLILSFKKTFLKDLKYDLKRSKYVLISGKPVV